MCIDVGMHIFLPKPANTNVVSALLELKSSGLEDKIIREKLSQEFGECRISKSVAA